MCPFFNSTTTEIALHEKKIIEAKEISMTKLSVELFLVSNLLVGFLHCFLYNKYILWLYFTSLLVMIVCKKVTKNVLKFFNIEN